MWGTDNSIDPFVKLTSSNTYNISQIQAALANKKKWQFYLKVNFGCNGVDPVYSDTIYMDDTPPAVLDPDSVSIDLVTQKMIAGWSKAPEPDVMGYSLFKTDQSTGNNDLIDEQNVLFYSFNVSDFDPVSGWNRFSLAVYDSCKNGGVISNYHSPVLLKFVTGQNVAYQCTRKIYLEWKAYVGWLADKYDIMVFDETTGIWSLNGTVSGSQLSYIFQIPSLGRKYRFYVRAHKQGSSITSSSNLIIFDAKDFIYPSYKSIGHVSVIGDDQIQITGKWEPTASTKTTALQFRIFGSSVWNTIAVFPGASGTIGRYVHSGRNAAQIKYEYRLLINNTCDEPMDSTSSHVSMVLKRSLFTFTWNDYWAWNSLNYETDLHENPKGGSTWNPLFVGGDSVWIVADTMVAKCFRVASYLKGVNNKPIDTAYSNIICLRAIDTTLIPGAFSPGGQNPVFKIINPNLAPGQAILKVYDRWGQKAFEGDALVGWDGKDRDGNFYLAGIYVYLIEIKRPEKNEAFKGTIMLMR